MPEINENPFLLPAIETVTQWKTHNDFDQEQWAGTHDERRRLEAAIQQYQAWCNRCNQTAGKELDNDFLHAHGRFTAVEREFEAWRKVLPEHARNQLTTMQESLQCAGEMLLRPIPEISLDEELPPDQQRTAIPSIPDESPSESLPERPKPTRGSRLGRRPGRRLQIKVRPRDTGDSPEPSPITPHSASRLRPKNGAARGSTGVASVDPRGRESSVARLGISDSPAAPPQALQPQRNPNSPQRVPPFGVFKAALQRTGQKPGLGRTAR